MLIHRLKHPRTPPLYHSMVQTFTVWTSWHVRSSDDKYPWPECGKLTPVTTRQVRLWVHNNKLKAALMLHTSTDCSYSTLNFFQWLLSWLLHRISVTNLSSENNLPTFWLNAPVVIRAKVKRCKTECHNWYNDSYMYITATRLKEHCLLNLPNYFSVYIPSRLTLHANRKFHCSSGWHCHTCWRNIPWLVSCQARMRGWGLGTRLLIGCGKCCSYSSLHDINHYTVTAFKLK